MKIRKLMIAALVVGLTLAANAGSYLVHIKMPDDTVITFELPNIPTPDQYGMCRFHNKEGGNLIVHASNVWIEEKSAKGQSKTKKSGKL